MNPRVSRSSALASKATGYPIARVAAQIAAGRTLAEIPNVVTGTTVAAFEPALDYVVVKLPRFPFDKFPRADRTLGSQMKATGEVMAIDRTFGAALNKALRGLEQAGAGPLAEDPAWTPTLAYLAAALGDRPGSEPSAWPGALPDDEADTVIRWIDERGEACESTRFAQRSAAPIVLRRFLAPSDNRLWRVLALLRRGVPETDLVTATGINPWFMAELGRSIALERRLRAAGTALLHAGYHPRMATLLATAKRAGLGDHEIAQLAGVGERDLRVLRGRLALAPGYAMVDTCAAEFAAETPYFYSTYAAAGSEPEAPPVARPAALVIGSGPVRIGQGIEFDYCAVRAAESLRSLGWQAVMANSNPETVSTDFDASSRLYFEPLDAESVAGIVAAESPGGAPPLPVFVQFGGQTPLNLAASLAGDGVPLLGASLETINQAEDRVRFSALVERVGIPQPEGGMARSLEEAEVLAERIGYPVIVRPSFVIGGLAIDFAYSSSDLVAHLAAATVVDPDRPVRIDRYLEGVEVDVDAVGDGETVLVPGLLEHVEQAGVHSGDSVGVFPPQTVSESDQALIVSAMDRIVRALGVRGLVNAQFIVRDDGVYLIEVNPRASRTVPVHEQGDRRPDGGPGRPDRAGREAGGPRLAQRAPCAATVRGREGTGLLHREAARRGPLPGAVHAVHRRGHRDPRGRAGGDGQGADGGLARAAAAGAGRGAGPPHRGRSRQGAPGPVGAGAREGRLPAGRHARDAGGAGAAGPCRGAGREAGGGGRRRPGPDPRPDRVGDRPARRQHADAALRAGPGCRRDPAGRDRRGRALPDRDRDGRRRGRGPGPGPGRPARGGPLAGRMGARSRTAAGRSRKPAGAGERTRGMTPMPEIALDQADYRPGACNIGPAEIAQRRRFGIVGVALAAVLAVAFIAIGAAPGVRLLVALPLAGGAIGLLQARFRFCVAFAMAGLRNFGPLGAEERVEDAVAHNADLRRAATVVVAGLAIGLAGGVALALLPI